MPRISAASFARRVPADIQTDPKPAGLGCGPTVIALITDYVFGNPLKVRSSLAMGLPVMFLAAAVSGLIALRPYAASLERLTDQTSNVSRRRRSTATNTETAKIAVEGG